VSKRDIRLFLRDMLEAIEKIERYTEGLTLEKLWKDDLVVDAVVRNLEIVSEAAPMYSTSSAHVFQGWTGPWS